MGQLRKANQQKVLTLVNTYKKKLTNKTQKNTTQKTLTQNTKTLKMPETETSRLSGTVEKWLNHKGIGFLSVEGYPDLLVHHSQLKQSDESNGGFKSLETGSTVFFELGEDPKDDTKQIAINVTGVDGADCPARVKGKGKGKRSSGAKKEKKRKERIRMIKMRQMAM